MRRRSTLIRLVSVSGGLALLLLAVVLLMAALPTTPTRSLWARVRRVQAVPVRDWGFGQRTFDSIEYRPRPGGDLFRDRRVYQVHQTRLGPVVVSVRRRVPDNFE